MLKINGKYGDIKIEGRSVDIEKIPLEELNKNLEKLLEKQNKLLEKQNEYLSQILQ